MTSGHPFGDTFPLSFFVQMCSDVFGPKFTSGLLQRGVDLTMAEYGGRDVAVTNVVFVHGSLDPWHALGSTEDVSYPYQGGQLSSAYQVIKCRL